MTLAVITRGFAKNPGQVPVVQKKAQEFFKHMNSLVGFRLDCRLWIPRDYRFEDCDCGKTYSSIADWRAVESLQGDNFCGVLNHAVSAASSQQCSHALIVSLEAYEYVTIKSVMAMIRALNGGALVAGMVIHELENSIRRGRVANTCAMWDLTYLTAVGSFGFQARGPMIGENRPNAGCEEIYPLVHGCELIGGPCIALIDPPETAVWSPPTDMDAHRRKMASKEARQNAHLEALGKDPNFLERFVIK